MELIIRWSQVRLLVGPRIAVFISFLWVPSLTGMAPKEVCELSLLDLSFRNP